MNERRAIPPIVAIELARRYRARAIAEVELVAYLRGVADAMEVAPERVEGFDDTTGELLLGDANATESTTLD